MKGGHVSLVIHVTIFVSERLKTAPVFTHAVVTQRGNCFCHTIREISAYNGHVFVLQQWMTKEKSIPCARSAQMLWTQTCTVDSMTFLNGGKYVRT